MFKLAEPPPPLGVSVKEWDKILEKGPSVKKTSTTAPLSLIRKVAADLAIEGVTKKDRGNQIKREYPKLEDQLIRREGAPILAGGLGGAVLGGTLASQMKVKGMGPMGAYIGGVGGAVVGGALAHRSPEHRELAQRLEALDIERKQLAAVQGDMAQPLTDETLDRDRYADVSRQAAQAKLEHLQASKPVRIGAGLGSLGGLALGAYGGRKLGPMGIGELGAYGSIAGGLAGAGIGSLAAGAGGRKAMRSSSKRYDKAKTERDAIWEGAATLDKGASLATTIRKTAQVVAFEGLTEPAPLTSEEILLEAKLASVEDPELYEIASSVGSGYTPPSLEDALSTYELLGGTYKHAFGQQMFDSKQMAGSPAVSGGMAARAKTPMPQVQSAPVSVTTTSIGGQGNAQGSSAAPPTSTPSTPSSPTG